MFKRVLKFFKNDKTVPQVIGRTEDKKMKRVRRTFNFNVIEMDTVNDQKMDIQETLKKTLTKYCKENDIDKYSGLSDAELLEDYTSGVVVSEYSDVLFERNEIKFIPGSKGTLKVTVNFEFTTLHIGKISAEDVKVYKDWYGEKIKNVQAHVIGGNVKKVIEENQKKKIIKEKQPIGVIINLYTEELIENV